MLNLNNTRLVYFKSSVLIYDTENQMYTSMSKFSSKDTSCIKSKIDNLLTGNSLGYYKSILEVKPRRVLIKDDKLIVSYLLLIDRMYNEDEEDLDTQISRLVQYKSSLRNPFLIINDNETSYEFSLLNDEGNLILVKKKEYSYKIMSTLFIQYY